MKDTTDNQGFPLFLLVGMPFPKKSTSMKTFHIYLCIMICMAVSVKGQIITTVCGNGYPGYFGNGLAATAGQFYRPTFLAQDSVGNLYVSDFGNNLIREITVGGNVVNIAGGALPGFGGDGGPATAASLNGPLGLAFDNSGNLYCADSRNYRVRKIAPDGTITTVAGNGASGYSGDGGAATNATLNFPDGLATDMGGNLYIADYNNAVVRRVDASGMITTVAGSFALGWTGYHGDHIPATAASLNGPCDVAVDGAGNMFISDQYNQRIRKVDSAGIITTFANDTTAPGLSPIAVKVAPGGDVFVSDNHLNVVWRFDTAGGINVVAGNESNGFSGDGGSAVLAEMYDPYGLAINASGTVWVADGGNNRIRAFTIGGSIETIAGGSTAGWGNGGSAATCEVNGPEAVAVDAAGNIYIADAGNSCIRRIDHAAGTISLFAGTGTVGFSGDGGPATAAAFLTPSSLAFDTSGNLYIADAADNRIRRIDPSGIISTFAGNGLAGFYGDGGPATACSFDHPTSICTDSEGDLYVCDMNNNRLRKIAPDGTISTFAGTGAAGYGGSGGPATAAMLHGPDGVAADAAGNVYFSDGYNYRIRMVSPSGTMSDIGGTGAPGYSGDGGPAWAAAIGRCAGLAIDPASHNLLVADIDNNLIREITPSGTIATFAGTDTAGFRGDGGLATAALLTNPYGVSFDHNGNLLVADYGNNRIRSIAKNDFVPVLSPPFSGWSVYPNPSAGTFVVRFEGATDSLTQLRVVDISGRQVWQSTIGTLTPYLLKTPLPDGTYFLEAAVGKEKRICKVSIVHTR